MLISAPTTTIYLVRHGENLANLTREFSSRRVDYPLTARGIQQARETAAHFAGKPLAAVYASPLRRAAQTAEIIAEPHGLPVLVREAFREIDVGRLEDEPPSAENWALHDCICARSLAGERTARFPGGDSQEDLLRRMREGLREIVTHHPGREVVVAAHGGIVLATIYLLCRNATPGEPAHIPNCAITELAMAPREGTLWGEVRAWAACDHLSDALVVPSRGEECEEV